MLRDSLLVIGFLAVLVIGCMIAFDYYQSPIVTKAPPAPVVGKPTGDYDPNKPDETKRGPRPPSVRIFTELNAYAEWYLSRQADPGFHLRPPKTVDFQHNQMVAILWGDKPTGGFTIAVDSVVEEDAATLVNVVTTAPSEITDPAPCSPAVAVATPKGKRLRIVIRGSRIPERNGFTDFQNVQTLEYDIELNRGS